MRPNFQQPKEMDTLQEIRSLRGKRCCRWGHGLRSNLQIAPFPACVTVARVVSTISQKRGWRLSRRRANSRKRTCSFPPLKSTTSYILRCLRSASHVAVLACCWVRRSSIDFHLIFFRGNTICSRKRYQTLFLWSYWKTWLPRVPVHHPIVFDMLAVLTSLVLLSSSSRKPTPCDL
jgi:hypothetical protein